MGTGECDGVVDELRRDDTRPRAAGATRVRAVTGRGERHHQRDERGRTQRTYLLERVLDPGVGANEPIAQKLTQ